MKNLNVLIIGSGGREHALAWKIAKSPMVKKLFCAPGNPGMAEIAECVNIDPLDIDSLLEFAKNSQIGLTIVGPEDPLTLGIVDKFQDEGLLIFGPNKKAAILEGSKVFAKNLMKKHGIPTADYMEFDDYNAALNYVKAATSAIVVKADGLAKGKGVTVCQTREEAIDAVNLIMKDKVFGEAGNKVVIEEFIDGTEVSVMAITDGKTILTLETAQDHKAIYNGDKGPNTGGMGAYSPAPDVTEKLSYDIEKQVLVPMVHAMKKEGCPFNGLLYAGLMLGKPDPKIKVLEFNVRFGDPETQPLMARIKSDLVPVLLAASKNELDKACIEWDSRPSVSVVVASNGYPDKYETGKEITGIDKLKDSEDITVFHSGTKIINDKIVTNGGRVLSVTSLGDDIKDAKSRAYNALKEISFDGAYWRTDIASKAIS